MGQVEKRSGKRTLKRIRQPQTLQRAKGSSKFSHFLHTSNFSAGVIIRTIQGYEHPTG